MAHDTEFEQHALFADLQSFEDRAVAHAYAVLRGDGYRGARLSSNQYSVLRSVADRRGVARAISIGHLAEQLDTTPREIKAVVRDLRLLFLVKVGSSRDSDGGGIYLITNKRELFDTVRPFVRQAQSEFAIAKALCQPHELAELEGQMRLDEGSSNGKV